MQAISSCDELDTNARGITYYRKNSVIIKNAIFLNIISWRSVSLMGEIGVHGEITDMSQVTDKLYHIMLYTSPQSN